MGGDQNGLALVLQLLQKVGDHFGGDDVQAIGGLVKDDDVRVVDDGHHQGNLLLHAGRQVGHFYLGKLVDAEPGEEGGLPLLPHRRGHPVEVGKKIEEVIGGEAVLQLQLTGEKADAGTDLLRLLHHAEPIHQGIPAVGTDEGGEHTQCGGFARAVSP